MFAPPLGISYFSLDGLLGPNGICDTQDMSRKGVSDEKIMAAVYQNFMKYLLIDIGLNVNSHGGGETDPDDKGNTDDWRPRDFTHPRDDGKNEQFPYYHFHIMYGRDGTKLERARRYTADWSKHKASFEAGFLLVPMPTPEERYFWIDCKFPIRGIYIPLCPIVPGPCKRLCQYARINFGRLDNCQIPFARPYNQDYYESGSHEQLKEQIAKTQLDLAPATTMIKVDKTKLDKEVVASFPAASEHILHPYLRDIPRFTSTILGEKEGSKKELFQGTDQETKDSKDLMKKWLQMCKTIKPDAEQTKRIKEMDACATKYGLERKHNQFMCTLNPTYTLTAKEIEEREKGVFGKLTNTVGIVGIGEDLDELMPLGMGTSTEWDQNKSYLQRESVSWPDTLLRTEEIEGTDKTVYTDLRTAIMTSPDADPDAVMAGTAQFETSVKYGLKVRPEVTLRFDVSQLQCLLAIPDLIKAPRKEDPTTAEVQEVSEALANTTSGTKDLPFDIWQHNFVLAFGAEDIKVMSSATQGEEWKYSLDQVITYDGIIRKDLGLNMQFVPADPDPLKALGLFMVQILAVLAEAACGPFGPFLAMAIYMGGEALIDHDWAKQYDNSAPPVLTCLFSYRGKIGKGLKRLPKPKKITLGKH